MTVIAITVPHGKFRAITKGPSIATGGIRADVDNRAGSDRKASQKRAANKQVQRADPSQKRFVQGPAARRSGLRADAGRHRMQADRHRLSQMRMPADLDRRSFAAQRGVDRAMRGFGGGVDRAMRGFGGRRR